MKVAFVEVAKSFRSDSVRILSCASARTQIYVTERELENLMQVPEIVVFAILLLCIVCDINRLHEVLPVTLVFVRVRLHFVRVRLSGVKLDEVTIDSELPGNFFCLGDRSRLRAGSSLALDARKLLLGDCKYCNVIVGNQNI